MFSTFDLTEFTITFHGVKFDALFLQVVFTNLIVMWTLPKHPAILSWFHLNSSELDEVQNNEKQITVQIQDALEIFKHANKAI